MKRSFYIKLHLYFSGVALLFMFFMALSGSLHLFMGNESETVSDVKTISVDENLSKDQLEALFSEELKKIDPSYSYSYMKGSATSLTTRPTSRTFYTFKVKAGSASIQEHRPTVRKSLMELHKGHGARYSRTVLGIFGLFVLGALISGFWLGISLKTYRLTTLVTLASGGVIYFILLCS